MKDIDLKVQLLRKLTDNFLYIEYYTHTGGDMYKIVSPYSSYRKMVHVLTSVTNGIEEALDLAIIRLTLDRKEFGFKDIEVK